MPGTSKLDTSESTHYYRGIAPTAGGEGPWGEAKRLTDVMVRTDLHPRDTVLDVGCAEGLITLEVARKVRHVRALDVVPQRIEAAGRLAADRNVSNVTFECMSVCDLKLAGTRTTWFCFSGCITTCHAKRRCRC